MPQVIQADDLTANLGTDDCRQFRQHVFSDLSPIAVDLALRYTRTAERFSYDKANQELLELHDRLRVGDLNLCASTEELKTTAKSCAEKCRLAQQRAKTPARAYSAGLKIVEFYNLIPSAKRPLEDGVRPEWHLLKDWRL